MKKVVVVYSQPTSKQKVTSAPSRETTKITVKIEWPSQVRQRCLPEDLHQIAKVIVRGAYKEIAAAVWKHEKIKPFVIERIQKEVDEECYLMCSSKKPSLLRQTPKDKMMQFSFEDLENEMKLRAPIFLGIIKSASRKLRSKDTASDLYWLPATCIAASICLKNRNPCMTALQLLVTTILQHSGMMVGFLSAPC